MGRFDAKPSAGSFLDVILCLTRRLNDSGHAGRRRRKLKAALRRKRDPVAGAGQGDAAVGASADSVERRKNLAGPQGLPLVPGIPAGAEFNHAAGFEDRPRRVLGGDGPAVTYLQGKRACREGKCRQKRDD